MAAITSQNGQILVASQADVARTWLQRAVGLLSRTRLEAGEALVIPGCAAIHTWFMRFPIDVVFLRYGRAVRTVGRLGPFRFAWAPGADTVIELPAGRAAEVAIEPGTVLSILEAEAPQRLDSQ